MVGIFFCFIYIFLFNFVYYCVDETKFRDFIFYIRKKKRYQIKLSPKKKQNSILQKHNNILQMSRTRSTFPTL